MRPYQTRCINTAIPTETLLNIIHNNPFTLIGTIPSLHALTLSPIALSRYTIPRDAKLSRYIFSPPNSSHLIIRETVVTEDEQLIVTFHRPKSEIWELMQDLRQVRTRGASPIGALYENKSPEELLYASGGIRRLCRTAGVMLLYVDRVYIRTMGRERADRRYIYQGYPYW